MPKNTFHNLDKDKQDRLLNIAIAEFAEYPYEVASLSNIVRKAGIAKGSVYQYFNNKKDLYQYLITLGIDKKIQLTKENPMPIADTGLFGYLRWQFVIAVLFEIHHPHLAKVTYRAFVDDVPFPEMTEELQRRGTTQFFKQLLSQGLLHSEVAPWVDPDIAGFLMESVFYQFGKYFVTRLNLDMTNTKDMNFLKEEQAQQLFSNLMDIIEAGMKRDPEQRKIYYNKD